MSFISIKSFLKLYIYILLFSEIYSQLTIIYPTLLSSKFINNTIDIEYGQIGLLTIFIFEAKLYLKR